MRSRAGLAEVARGAVVDGRTGAKHRGLRRRNRESSLAPERQEQAQASFTGSFSGSLTGSFSGSLAASFTGMVGDDVAAG